MFKQWFGQSESETRPAARAAAVESLEGRRYMADSAVIAGTKVKTKNLFDVNNISLNQSLLTIPFTGNIAIEDSSKLQVRGYAINPISGKQKKMVVNVVKAEILAADHSYLQITTDRLMRKGGAIILYAGSLKDEANNPLAEQTVNAVKGQNKERFTLACRAFKVTDLTKFSSVIFTGAPNGTTASTTQSDAVVRPKLVTFMNAKVSAGLITQAQANAAVARYDNATTKGIVPDHNLRAAMVSLTGTLAASAIASFIDGTNLTGKPYTVVDFDTPPDPSAVVAQTIITPAGRLRTVIKPEFKGEPFQVVSAYLAHEALHQDASLALEEEEVATTMETMVYAQQIGVDAAPLSSGTKLVLGENEKLLALLNSGKTIFPYVGLENGTILGAASGVFQPGAKSVTGGVYTSYENFIKRGYLARGATSGQTAGNALLDSYYTAVTGKAPSNVKFNQTLIDDIDSFQAPVSTTLAVKLAGALKLSL